MYDSESSGEKILFLKKLWNLWIIQYLIVIHKKEGMLWKFLCFLILSRSCSYIWKQFSFLFLITRYFYIVHNYNKKSIILILYKLKPLYSHSRYPNCFLITLKCFKCLKCVELKQNKNPISYKLTENLSIRAPNSSGCQIRTFRVICWTQYAKFV